MDAPDHLINEYISLLEKEIESYRQFRDLLMEEQGILISGKIQEVHANVRKQEILAREIRRMEAFRNEKTNELAKEFSLKKIPLMLRDIIKVVPDTWKERLVTLLEEFRYLVQDVVKLNRNNAKLIQNGISFVQHYVEALYKIIDKDFFYHPQRKHSSKSEKIVRLVDRKI